MELFEKIYLQDCPRCGGPALLEDANGWCYIVCMDCGCQTGGIEYKTEEEKVTAAEKAAYLWNMGKNVSPDPGE